MKFIVYKEEYCRYGTGGCDVTLHEAASLDELVLQLESPDEVGERGICTVSPSDFLKEANGDGMAFYIIKRLTDKGLSKNLLDN